MTYTDRVDPIVKQADAEIAYLKAQLAAATPSPTPAPSSKPLLGVYPGARPGAGFGAQTVAALDAVTKIYGRAPGSVRVFFPDLNHNWVNDLTKHCVEAGIHLDMSFKTNPDIGLAGFKDSSTEKGKFHAQLDAWQSYAGPKGVKATITGWHESDVKKHQGTLPGTVSDFLGFHEFWVTDMRDRGITSLEPTYICGGYPSNKANWTALCPPDEFITAIGYDVYDSAPESNGTDNHAMDTVFANFLSGVYNWVTAEKTGRRDIPMFFAELGFDEARGTPAEKAAQFHNVITWGAAHPLIRRYNYFHSGATSGGALTNDQQWWLDTTSASAQAAAAYAHDTFFAAAA